MGVFTVRLRNGWRLSQSDRLPAPRYQYRGIATKRASSGESSDVVNPQSSNSESESMDISRDGETFYIDTADRRSVASPVSSERGSTSEAHEGEEQTELDLMIKTALREPAE